MIIELTITSALLIGLLGSSHCLAMCGGLGSLLGGSSQGQFGRIVSYNSGRLLTYAAIGALAGLFGEQLVKALPQSTVLLRVIAGLLLIAMGLYVSQWWTGLTKLEQGGAVLWRYIQPLTGKLLPVQNHGQALLLGALWGFLPCGLVYSTLSWALAAAHWQQSALFMLAFGVGTLPAMLTVGFINDKLLQHLRGRNFKRLAGLIIIGMGLLTLWLPLTHNHHNKGEPSDEQGHQHQH